MNKSPKPSSSQDQKENKWKIKSNNPGKISPPRKIENAVQLASSFCHEFLKTLQLADENKSSKPSRPQD
jgi:hypothetical protein